MVKYYCGLCETSHHALVESYQCEQCARIYCKQSIQEMISAGMNNCPYCDHSITIRIKVKNSQSDDIKKNQMTIPSTSTIDETFESQEYELLVQLETLIGEKIPKKLEIKDWFFGFLKYDNHITGLGLWGKGLTTLSDNIVQLTKLEILDLSDNKLTTLPESIGELSNLQELYLSGNNLISLPQTIGRLRGLKKLYLDNNQLMSLPESIGTLLNLEELALDENQLTVLPDSISQLTNLHTLFFDHNRLSELPETIAELNSLQFLDWSANDLDTENLSSTIRNWLNLTEKRSKRN